MKTSPQNPNEDELLEFCDEIHADDGVSPEELSRRKQKASRQISRRKPNHHTRQLCKQACRAIDESIVCDCGDPVLDDLRTVWVRPAGKGGQKLEVTFTTAETDLEKIALMYEALRQVSGILRSAVAGSITRKRVPQLTFRIVPEKQHG